MLDVPRTRCLPFAQLSDSVVIMQFPLIWILGDIQASGAIDHRFTDTDYRLQITDKIYIRNCRLLAQINMPCTRHVFSNIAPFPIHMRLVELASFAGNIAGRYPLKDFAGNPSNGSPAQLPRARKFASTNEIVNGGAPKAGNF